MADMRGNEAAMRRLADFPIDHGQQEPTRETAMAKALKPWGYRPPPTDETIRHKYDTELRAGVGELLRSREMLEGTNFVSELHPIHDTPFFAQDIHFSERQTVIGVDAVYSIQVGTNPNGTVNSRNVAFIRSVEVLVFDASADTDLRVALYVSKNLLEGFDFIQPSALMPFRQNSYVRMMQNQSLEIVVRNTNVGVPHDALVRVHGWRYPVPDVKETARGTIPKVS
jgi:hypothetical protein